MERPSMKAQMGSVRPGNCKLTRGDVLAMKRDFRDGVSVKDVAAQYGMSTAAVYEIRAGRRWGHVQLGDES